MEVRVRSRLASDKLHRDALAAMEKALRAGEPHNLIRRNLKLDGQKLRVNKITFSLNRYRRIFVIGGGKASGYMAEEVERLLGERITAGRVNIPDYLKPKPKGRRIKYHPATHPIPGRKGLEGVHSMLSLARNLSAKDFVICLISGGGSALMPLPSKGISLREEQKVTSLLLRSGATIDEINTVRKHLSQLKGGRLAERLFPATVLTLIISDVVGDRLDSIASGPTVPDPTTYQDARDVLEKYNLWRKVSARIRNVLEGSVAGSLPDTPKPGDRVFRHVHNVLVGTNRESCRAAAASLGRAGYRTLVLSTRVVGEASLVGKIFAGVLTDMRENSLPLPPPAALVTGGETTVTIEGKGKGGRNQELVLAAALGIDGLKGVVVGSLASDGVDGLTNAAGALADGTTIKRGLRLKMDPGEYLMNNDSYHYFSRLGDLIITGPTGTNVNDIMILAAK